MNKNSIKVTFTDTGLETALGGFHTPCTLLLEKYTFNKVKDTFKGNYTTETAEDVVVKEVKTVAKEEVTPIPEELKEEIDLLDKAFEEELAVPQKETKSKKKNKK